MSSGIVFKDARARLLLLTLTSALVVGLPLSIYHTAARLRGLDAALRERGRLIATQLARRSAARVSARDVRELRAFKDALLRRPDIAHVTVTDAGGVVLVRGGTMPGYPDPGPAPKSRTPRVTRAPDRSLIVRTPILAPGTSGRGGEVLGWLQIAVPDGWLERERNQVVYSGLLVLLAVTGLALTLSLILTRAPYIPPSPARAPAARRPRTRGPPPERHTTGTASSPKTPADPERETPAAARVPRSRSPEILLEVLEWMRIRNAELEFERRKALEGSKAKSVFLSSMSHEIRTPMNSVLGYCNLLLRTPLDAPQREYANNIKRSAECLLPLIDGILDFSRIEAGKLELQSTAFDFRECVEDALALLAPAAHDKDLELASLVSPHVPDRLRGDPDRIRQVLINLTTNAIKFTSSGSVVVRCTLDSVRGSTVYVLISVTDTGVGIRAEDRKRLFKAFSQTASAQACHSGTGLGLVISKKLAESMGGSIGVESRPGRGSTFWFTVRCERGPATARNSSVTARLKGHSVLLWVARPYTRFSLREMLSHWGMPIVEVTEGSAFAAALDSTARQGRRCAAAIVDLADTAWSRELGRQAGARGCPVLALRSSTDAEGGRDGGDNGISTCLIKPVRYRELQAALARLVSGNGELTADRAQHHPPAAQPLALRGAGARVLVVDDDGVSRRYVATLLEQCGIRIATARTGREALARAGEQEFDAVLMDLHLPDMNGATAAVRIRALGPHAAHTPVIALTGDAARDNRKKLLAAGMTDYLIKPVDEGALSRALLRCLRHLPDPGRNAPGPGDAEAGHGHRNAAEGPLPTVAPEWRSRLGTGEPLARELFALLAGDLSGRRTAIEEALARGEHARAASQAHTIAGGAACCGTPALHEAARALEQAVAGGDASRIDREWRRLRRAMDEVLEWSRELHAKLPDPNVRARHAALPPPRSADGS